MFQIYHLCEIWGSQDGEVDDVSRGFSSGLKTRTVCLSKTLVSTYESTRCHKPKDEHPQILCTIVKGHKSRTELIPNLFNNAFQLHVLYTVELDAKMVINPEQIRFWKVPS
jgi:hypothetical protein